MYHGPHPCIGILLILTLWKAFTYRDNFNMTCAPAHLQLLAFINLHPESEFWPEIHLSTLSLLLVSIINIIEPTEISKECHLYVVCLVVNLILYSLGAAERV